MAASRGLHCHCTPLVANVTRKASNAFYLNHCLVLVENAETANSFLQTYLLAKAVTTGRPLRAAKNLLTD